VCVLYFTTLILNKMIRSSPVYSRKNIQFLEVTNAQIRNKKNFDVLVYLHRHWWSKILWSAGSHHGGPRRLLAIPTLNNVVYYSK
jgi:hypothetical protein